MRGNGNFNKSAKFVPGKAGDTRGGKPFGKAQDGKPYGKTGGRTFADKPGRGGKPYGERDAKRSVKPEAKPQDVKAKDAEDDFDDSKPLVLEGRNAVLEALAAEKTIDRILVKQNAEGMVKVIIARAREKGIVVQEVTKQKLDETSETGNHQSVIALCPAHEYATVEDMLDAAAANRERVLF